MVSLAQFVVWMVVGLLGGSLAGLIITRERQGFGVWRNLALGLVGALVGGLLFRLLRLFPALDKVAISVLPTPASPSRNSGRFRCNAKCTAVARLRSAT